MWYHTCSLRYEDGWCEKDDKGLAAVRAALAAAPAEAMDAGRMNGIALAVNVASMNAGPWGLALLRLLLADGYVGGVVLHHHTPHRVSYQAHPRRVCRWPQRAARQITCRM